jgi:high-affinity K+ transport system ATPase subunit B
MNLANPDGAILSAIIFNEAIIASIALVRRGVA